MYYRCSCCSLGRGRSLAGRRTRDRLLGLNRRNLPVVFIQLPLVLDELSLVFAFQLLLPCRLSRVLHWRSDVWRMRLSGRGWGRVSCCRIRCRRILPTVGVHQGLTVLRGGRCSVAIRLLIRRLLVRVLSCYA